VTIVLIRLDHSQVTKQESGLLMAPIREVVGLKKTAYSAEGSGTGSGLRSTNWR
jgi:hypothetical protein